jgi:hypothetical protein
MTRWAITAIHKGYFCGYHRRFLLGRLRPRFSLNALPRDGTVKLFPTYDEGMAYIAEHADLPTSAHVEAQEITS